MADEEITTTLDYSHLRPNVSLVPASVFDASAFKLEASAFEEEKVKGSDQELADAVRIQRAAAEVAVGLKNEAKGREWLLRH